MRVNRVCVCVSLRVSVCVSVRVHLYLLLFWFLFQIIRKGYPEKRHTRMGVSQNQKLRETHPSDLVPTLWRSKTETKEPMMTARLFQTEPGIEPPQKIERPRTAEMGEPFGATTQGPGRTINSVLWYPTTNCRNPNSAKSTRGPSLGSKGLAVLKEYQENQVIHQA